MPYDIRGELLTSWESGPQVVRALVREVDASQARWRPAPGEWAIVEVVEHLADAEVITIERMRQVLEEERPVIAAYDPAALAVEREYIAGDLATALDRFARVRAEELALVEGLSDEQWRRVGLHEEIGEFALEELLAHMVMHDAVHLQQLAGLIEGYGGERRKA
jgi:hypothetical protein